MTKPDVDAGSPTSGEGPIGRAFRVLQVVIAAGESVGVRELGRRSGLPRSTVSRLVGILTELGMLTRTANGAILPGSALATLQPGGATGALLGDRLRPLLVELVQAFGENAALSIDDRDRLLYVSQVSADHPVSVPDVTGETQRFHLVAPGLLTMAWWESGRLDAALADRLEPATPHSMTDPAALRGRIAAAGVSGWCWTDQELDVGVNGLAVPIIDDDRLLATISLFGPDYRFSADRLPNLATELTTMVADRIVGLLH